MSIKTRNYEYQLVEGKVVIFQTIDNKKNRIIKKFNLKIIFIGIIKLRNFDNEVLKVNERR